MTAPPVIDLSQSDAAPPEPATVNRLFDVCECELIEGSKEANTRETEKVHRRHLEAHFGDPELATVDHKAIQGYVNARAAGLIARVTIRKELATLRLVWNWGTSNGHAPALPWQMKKLIFPKSKMKEPFQDMVDPKCWTARGPVFVRVFLQSIPR